MPTHNQVDLLLELHRLESAANGTYGGEEFLKVEEQLERSLLKEYQKIRERRGGGVALLQRQTCSGCRMVYPDAHPVVQYRELVHKCEYCGRLLVTPKTSIPEESREQDSISDTSLMDDHEDDDADDDSSLMGEVEDDDREYQPDDDMMSHLMLHAGPDESFVPAETVEEPYADDKPGAGAEREDEDKQREELDINDIEDEEAEWEEPEEHLREQGTESVEA